MHSSYVFWIFSGSSKINTDSKSLQFVYVCAGERCKVNGNQNMTRVSLEKLNYSRFLENVNFEAKYCFKTTFFYYLLIIIAFFGMSKMFLICIVLITSVEQIG